MPLSSKPAAGSADGIPGGYVLPAGATLVEQRGPTWSYAIARPPGVVAAELAAALQAAGWLSVVRHIGAEVPTVTAVQDGPVVIAIADADGVARTRLTLVVNATGNLLTTRPAHYPADFPFLPFGAVQAEARDDRTVLVYSAKGTDIVDELGDRFASAGWDFHGDLDALLVCRKGNVSVSVAMDELSADKVVLFVSNAETSGDIVP